MKFIDFLKVTPWIDGEVVTKGAGGLESKYSFCWGNDTKFTEEGMKKFEPILQSDIEVRTSEHYGMVITLLNESITEELYDLFMAAQAGYVSCKLYDKWVKEAA